MRPASIWSPAFQKMQAEIFAGGVDTVIVWKLDRLARNLEDGINTVADWCQRGIRVVSITQQTDLNGPVGQLITGVLFGIAQIEQPAHQGTPSHRHCRSEEKGRLYRTAARHYKSASRARDRLLAIRGGQTDWDEVEKWRLALHRELDEALAATALPEHPDYHRANQFLIGARRLATSPEYGA